MSKLDELEQLAKSTMSSTLIHIEAYELLTLIDVARAAEGYRIANSMCRCCWCRDMDKALAELKGGDEWPLYFKPTV